MTERKKERERETDNDKVRDWAREVKGRKREEERNGS